nr:hypothetical protein [Polymorphobacter sp.]
MTMRLILALGLALAATPALAAPPPAPQSAVDPARLAAAREVVALAMPPATRDAMLTQMSTALSNTMRQGMLASPQIKAMFAQDPRVQPIFERYLAKVQARTAETIRAGMPPLYDAMAAPMRAASHCPSSATSRRSSRRRPGAITRRRPGRSWAIPTSPPRRPR